MAPRNCCYPKQVTPEWLTEVLNHAGYESTVADFSMANIGTGQVGQNPLAKGIDKIKLVSLPVEHPDGDSSFFVGRITNKGTEGADNVFVEIKVYDKQGTLILVETEEMPSLAAGRSRKLTVDLGVDASIFGEAKARITGVAWDTF